MDLDGEADLPGRALIKVALHFVVARGLPSSKEGPDALFKIRSETSHYSYRKMSKLQTTAFSRG